MSQVRTLITTVAGAQFKAQHQATEEFWRRLAASNGGRQGDPHDYAEIVDIYYDEGRGWVIEYEVPAELLEQREVSVIREDPEPNCQNVLKPAKLADAAPVQAPKPRPKCHVLSCTSPCIEGSSYCDQHQDKDGRFKDTNQPTEIMPSLIQVTGHNPRKTFDPAQLEELKASIREHGIIEPLMVRPKGNSRYELVVGERRLRAARELGLEHVPVVVRQLTDGQMLDIMLAENLQRVDLNPIEEAHHLKRVLEVGKLTQTELGRRVGKSQEWVSQRLRLAEAPAALQDEIIRRRINPSAAADLLAWKDTEHFGLLLLRVDEAIREEVEDGGLGVTVKRVREIIKEITEPAPYGSNMFTVAPDVKEGEIQPGTMVIINTDGTVAPVYAAEASDPPFVNPEDCKDCDIYDRENDTCPEGCTCDEECEDCFCEVTEDEGARQDLPQEPEPVADPADMAVGLKRNAMILELAKNRPMNCTCERDPWDNGVRTFECRICHEVFIDQKGMETFVMVRHLIGDVYRSDHRDAAQAVLAKAHIQPIKEALQRYFVGGSEVEDDVRIREQEADVAVNDFDRESGFGGPSYMEEQCRAGNKDAIEARKARNKLTEARLKIRKEAKDKGVAL